MRILIVTQYFWPENMRINDLANFLVSKNHDVTILTGKPNYPEGKIIDDFKKNPDKYTEYNGIKIIRVPLITRGNNKFKLFLNYLSFLISASTYGLFKLKEKDFDIIFANQLSPIISIIPAVFIKKSRKIPLVMWILDLWPETLQTLKIVNNKKILLLLDQLSGWIYKHTDIIMIQSEAFKDSILRCYAPHKNIIYCPNWAETIFEKQFQRKEILDSSYKKSDVFNIVFAGNIGQAQDFDSIVMAADTLRNEKNIFWHILGDGRDYQRVKKLVKDKDLIGQMIFYGRYPLESMPLLFQSSDALLISLTSGDAFFKTIPGKLQSYMASGKPIVSMIGGETNKVINNAKCGLTAKSGDYKELASNIVKLSKLTMEERDKMGRNAINYFNQYFQRDHAMNKIEETLKSAVKENIVLN